ncbi:MAG: type IV secretion system DNA-binding domain-containing protein [Verrucomicrobiota bacterium JB024]|nr:type IV secretion system DNA-binding domain-containing protein [Verrucomicrobiota bacterium JB024]
MPYGNLILSLFSGTVAYVLLGRSSPLIPPATGYIFGTLSAWQFFRECLRLHLATSADAKTKPDSNPVVFRLGRFTWRQSEACRHWFVSGQTGSGKTFFFRRMIWQLCEHVPTWGGLVLDEKGAFIEVLRGIFKHHPTKEESDLIVIEVRSNDSPADWQPPVTFNFLEVPGIPYSNHAKTIVDVASSLLGKGSENPYFPQQATIQIEWGLRCLKVIREPVTLKRCYELLTNDENLKTTMDLLEELKTPEARTVWSHFQSSYLSLNEDTFRGVQSSIAGYLSYFTSPEIAEVFCPKMPSTLRLTDLDAGKVVTVSLPQKYAVERKYIYTLLKLTFYNHGIQRFDRPQSERDSHNLLVGLFDEFQKVATASEAGLSDYNTVDTLREAKVMVMTGTQSTQSLVPPMGADKAKVFIANMANRVIFKAADEESAKTAADCLGKHEVWRKSHGVSGGKRSFNKHKEDRYFVQPHEFRKLRKFECVLQHCEGPWQKLTLPPIGLDGRICDWWAKAKRRR